VYEEAANPESAKDSGRYQPAVLGRSSKADADDVQNLSHK
jgi:hypothetical protein